MDITLSTAALRQTAADRAIKSIRIQIEAWRRARESEETIKVTQALFTFVAIDENRRPRAVPPETTGSGGA